MDDFPSGQAFLEAGVCDQVTRFYCPPPVAFRSCGGCQTIAPESTRVSIGRYTSSIECPVESILPSTLNSQTVGAVRVKFAV